MPDDNEALDLAYALRDQATKWYQELGLVDSSRVSIELMNQLFARHDLLRGWLSADPRAGAERPEADAARASCAWPGR